MPPKKIVSDMERGWQYASENTGFIVSGIEASAAHDYIEKVSNEIALLKKNLLSINPNGPVNSISGFAAEYWHEGTFNINAAAAGSDARAKVLEGLRNQKFSPDIRLTDAAGETTDYGLKYYATAEKSAVQQAILDPETKDPGYHGQKRLVPSDQLTEGKAAAHRRALSNETVRPDVARAYSETEAEMVDTVSDGKVSSEPLSKKESADLAKEIKEKDLDLEKHGASVETAVKPQYIMQRAVKAGLTSMSITMIIRTAPDIYQVIAHLIKTGKIDINRVRSIGVNAISSGAEGFLRGAVAYSLQALCEKGVFGEVMKAVDPLLLGTAVALVIETLKNTILVAAGKMTSKEMGLAFANNVMVASGYALGCKIGGAVGLAFGLPFLSYLVGTLAGSCVAVVLGIGKKKLISFCTDTGFTCFGLVKQDYAIPKEALRDMGIDLADVSREVVSRADVPRAQVRRAQVAQISPRRETLPDKIGLRELRRGIIGVNTIGYLYE